MYKLSEEKLIVNADNSQPVAVPVDSFVSALAEGRDEDWVILRLYQKNWSYPERHVPEHQVHQFAMTADRAKILGQELLAYAAQIEKKNEDQSSH